uniref:Apolipoprotein D n=1 Tax=Cacopsylla melanoneura TaxID=428564 RepID=A0A8D9FHE2_9HEMI
MFPIKASIALVLLVCCSASYGLIGFGSCPTKSLVSNFDLPRFSGFWYENRALEGIHLTQEGWGICQTILFDHTTVQNVSVRDNKNIFNDFLPFNRADNSQTNYTRQTTTISTIVFGKNHTGAINADFVPSKAEFKIHGTWRFLSIPVQTIGIVDTDYNNYAVLWTCQDMGVFNKQNAWILTRSSTLNSTVSNSIINSLFAQGLPETEFKVTDQSDCSAKGNRKPFFSPLAFSQIKTAHMKASFDPSKDRAKNLGAEFDDFEKGY